MLSDYQIWCGGMEFIGELARNKGNSREIKIWSKMQNLMFPNWYIPLRCTIIRVFFSPYKYQTSFSFQYLWRYQKDVWYLYGPKNPYDDAMQWNIPILKNEILHFVVCFSIVEFGAAQRNNSKFLGEIARKKREFKGN